MRALNPVRQCVCAIMLGALLALGEASAASGRAGPDAECPCCVADAAVHCAILCAPAFPVEDQQSPAPIKSWLDGSRHAVVLPQAAAREAPGVPRSGLPPHLRYQRLLL